MGFPRAADDDDGRCRSAVAFFQSQTHIDSVRLMVISW